jgi:eukaryotic-like serine/threonine-protein kinase
MERFLGRYEILGELGRGGMGVVHEARHTLLGKTVAIKVLLPHLAQDTEHVARFMREARAAANLNHPHIVQVFDVDQAGDVHFFAMERIEGETLRERVRARGPLPAGETVRIARQVADALAFAHARGIVHRDLKPANIMLDERGQVKVMDFGIAAAAGGETLTLTGQVLGTPKYMAPEQARGEEVDGRTDLFSLGMTMCEMLAGRTPLEGMDVISAVGMLLQRELPFALGLPTHVPADVQAIVVRLTQKERAARYPTAVALAQDLARAAGEVPGPPIADVESTLDAERTLPMAHPATSRVRSRRPLAIVAVTAIAAVAALALARWPDRELGGDANPGEAPNPPGTAADILTGDERATVGGIGPAATSETLGAAGSAVPSAPSAERRTERERRNPDSTAVAAKPSALPPPPGDLAGEAPPSPPAPPATGLESGAENRRDGGTDIDRPAEESPSKPAPPSTIEPVPPAIPDPAAQLAMEVERLRPELDRLQREVGRAREAADADSAQATASYRAARAREDSLAVVAARADAAGLARNSAEATALYGLARNERAAMLAQRAAAEERRRALAEPGRSSAAMNRAEELLAEAEAAMGGREFTAARSGYDAARAEFARAARKPR